MPVVRASKNRRSSSRRYVKLLTDTRITYLRPMWATLKAGTIVPVVSATNLPNFDLKGLCWLDTADLRDDKVGVLLESGEYQEIEPIDLVTARLLGTVVE